MERRLILIPFNATFSHELGNLDPHILEKLLAERSDIILDVLEAFKGVIERGYKFTESRAVKEELEGYNELSDSVARFTAASCVHKPGNKITTDIAYRCYVSWTDDLRLKPTSYQRFAKTFYKHLKNVVPQAERYRSDKARGVENVAIDYN
jgi:phage/plasmid-associated DNA primase